MSLTLNNDEIDDYEVYYYHDQVDGEQVEKKAQHNALERKRRDHIKGSFQSLRDCIPAIAGDRTSRAAVLNKATEYISTMLEKNKQHVADIEHLRSSNSRLSAQIANLEVMLNNKGIHDDDNEVEAEGCSMSLLEPQASSSNPSSTGLLPANNRHRRGAGKRARLKK